MADITFADIEAAEKRIRPFLRRTPLVPSAQREGLHLKLECLQRTGSFKLRGALNAVLAADGGTVRDGVSCVSAGNHGLAVAVAARQRKVKANVYVWKGAVPRKVAAMKAAGATVIEATVERLGEIMADQDAGDGTYFVHPFANRHVAAGQGTVGLEILQDVPQPTKVFVAIGGGGQALGIATVMAARSPRTKVYGVAARQTPAFWTAWKTGKTESVKSTSIADGLSAPIADLGVVRRLKELLADLVIVEDDQIKAAMRGLALEDKVVAEPAGAASTAAALAARTIGPSAVAMVSGGNVKPELLAEVLADPSP
ncbi:MAG TPA: pyridoxal-phosphate dependent enzyme [Candidatus Thermoplasmatota archaeon]|nr:pyridoxal-phosphate dependent enzyme [Candidatus Thermoplasmatota archaeon]